MVTNFPTGLDTLTNPTATDEVAVVSHSSQHANANDAIEALEEKVGQDGSAVTTSHDYKLSGVATGDKAVSKTGTETLTNKTLTTPVISSMYQDAGKTKLMSLPDTSSDILVSKDATQTLKNKTIDPTLNTIDGDKLDISFTPSYYTRTDTSETDDTSQLTAHLKGIDDKIGSIQIMPQTISSYFSNLSNISNQYSDVINLSTNSTSSFQINPSDTISQVRNVTSEVGGADTVDSVVILGDYVYVLIEENSTTPDTLAVYRYNKSNLSAGGTLMTFSGAKTLVNADPAVKMNCDGTNFYFSFEAGNSASSFLLAKYTLSGTTFTYDSTITCGSSAITYFLVLSSGVIFAKSTNDLLRFNSSGTLTNTYTGVMSSAGIPVNIKDTVYIGSDRILSITKFI